MTVDSHNPSMCKAQECAKQLCRANRSGYCRKCFCAHAKHPRKGGVKDSDRMKRVSRSRLAWCPIDLQPDYRRMTRIQGVRAPEARKIIQQHMNVQIERHYAGFEAVG